MRVQEREIDKPHDSQNRPNFFNKSCFLILSFGQQSRLPCFCEEFIICLMVVECHLKLVLLFACTSCGLDLVSYLN